jgi:DNA-directed RNA polymerase III subunit RPC1
MSFPPDEIVAVQMFVSGDRETKDDSYANVNQAETLHDGKPVPGGTYDARMGTTSQDINCQSCARGRVLCPGHSGAISLNNPVQNGTYRHRTIGWLKMICFTCGELPLNKRPQLLAMAPAIRMTEYTKMVRTAIGKACHVCQAVKKAVWQDDNAKVIIWVDVPDTRTDPPRPYTRLFNHHIVDIFRRVKPSTVELMGCPPSAHPSNFMIHHLRVLPNNTRPIVKRLGAGRSANNDLTTMYNAIIKINNAMPILNLHEPVSDSAAIEYTNLDLLVYELIHGNVASSAATKVITNTNRQPSGISNRMSGKFGRVRLNLMCARTWGILRSVITNDPTIPIDWIGIPLSAAREIQVWEIVTPYNRNRLMIHFHNRRGTYPGCSQILKKNTGRKYDVSSLGPDVSLEYGDTLWRDIVDGDPMAFNRPPSLQEQYMSCFSVLVLPYGNSIRLNVNACKWYNADYDGDSGVAFAPASTMSKNELSRNSAASHFISQQTGNSFVGSLLDALIAVAKFTRADTLVSRYSSMMLFSHDNSFVAPAGTATGRELMSSLIPPINYSTTAFFYKPSYAPYMKYDPDEYKVQIVRGQLRSGILDHAAMGEGRNDSIYHRVCVEYGPQRALDCVHGVQLVMIPFTNHMSHTVNLADIAISPAARKAMDYETSVILSESARVTERLRRGLIIPPVNTSTREFYEQLQSATLALGDALLEPLMSSIDTRNNGLFTMIMMAKKGTINHFQTIGGAIGQTLIGGKRIAENFGYGRTSPYSYRYTQNPVDRGFVADSLEQGTNPQSTAHQAGEARSMMVNKQLSTSVAGHMNREFVKNMESLIVNNMRHVACHTRVVQFLYGGHGMDIAKMVKVLVPHAMLDDAKFEEEYRGADAAEWRQLQEDRAWYRRQYLRAAAVYPNSPMKGDIMSPVDLKKIIDDVIYDSTPAVVGGRIRVVGGAPAAPAEAPAGSTPLLNQYCEELPYVYMNSQARAAHVYIPRRFIDASRGVCVLLRAYLCTRGLVRSGLTLPMLKLVFDKCTIAIISALLEYGALRGIISSLSMSEPATQYIISSHHRSGVTAGVNDSQTDKMTRIHEIINVFATEQMANPSMVLRVIQQHETDITKVTEIANKIEMMRVRRFLARIQIFFETYGKPVHPLFAHEQETIKAYEQHHLANVLPDDLTRWCIRLELSRRTMILKNMDLDTIVHGIMIAHPYIHVVYSDEGAETMFVRCYLRAGAFRGGASPTLSDVRDIKDTLLATVVRGVEGVHVATPIASERTAVDPATGAIVTHKIYVIKTNGTNLAVVLENPLLDAAECISDSVHEMTDLFGIEAGRERLRIELEKTLSGINTSHYELFADNMTITGELTGISRTGLVARERSNVLLRTSHSCMNQVLHGAAVTEQGGKIYGPSAPLMLGRMPHVGSTYNRVAVNTEFVRSHVKTLDDIMGEL